MPMIWRWWRGAWASPRPDSFSRGKGDWDPRAARGGPPMPANSIDGWRAFSAAIRCAASKSPEASPATMPTRTCRGCSSLLILLADDAAFTASEKFEDVVHLGAAGYLLAQLEASLLKAETAAIQRAIGALEAGDGFGRKAAALEAFAVDAVGTRHVAGGGDERRQVLGQIGAHAGEGVSADVHELVDQRRGAEDRPSPHRDVAGQLAGTGEDLVVANPAVVRERKA